VTNDFLLGFAVVMGLPPTLVCCAALIGWAVRGIRRSVTAWWRSR